MSDDWMVLLSGPLAQRAGLLATLAAAGVDVEQAHEPHGLPDEGPTVGWVCARHADVDKVVTHAARAGWSLRMHWPTPRCGVCAGVGKANGPAGLGDCLHCGGVGRTSKPAPTPEQQLAERLAELQQRIDRLEGRA